MRTNVVINDALMHQAMKSGKYETKKQTIEEALRLLVHLQHQTKIRKYRGKLKWSGNLEKMRED